MSIDLDVLEGLAKAGAPGPWDIPENNPIGAGLHVFALGLDGTRFIVANMKTDQTFVTATTREHQQVNAALIVAAVNALPDLIAAARERDGLREFIKSVAEIPLTKEGLNYTAVNTLHARGSLPKQVRGEAVVAVRTLRDVLEAARARQSLAPNAGEPK